ncbi:MAG: hypothetical protein JW874_08220 [Spirochaetales bacterium]|nr:hypothetical protein [Spirochaetales bacterium]
MKKFFIVTAIFMVLISGCHVNTDPEGPEVTTGDLTLTIAYPDTWPVTSFVIEHTLPDSTSDNETVTAAVVDYTDLDEGVHQFSVEAYNTGILIGTGSGSATITAGETATATVTLTAYVPTGTTGGINLTFTMPSGWTADHYIVLDERPDSAVDSYTMPASGLLSDLMSGLHILDINAYDADDVVLARGSAAVAVPSQNNTSATVDLAMEFTKYMWQNWDDMDDAVLFSSNYEEDVLDINLGDDQAVWTYTLDFPSPNHSRCLWTMNAIAVDGDVDFSDFNFGFAIDDDEPVLLDEPGETLVFNAAESDLPNGILVFDGYETIRAFNATPETPMMVRLNIAVFDSLDAPLALADPADYGLDAALGGVLPVTEDFYINISLDGSTDGGTSWDKVLDILNSVDVDPAAPLARTDIGSAIFLMEE